MNIDSLMNNWECCHAVSDGIYKGTRYAKTDGPCVECIWRNGKICTSSKNAKIPPKVLERIEKSIIEELGLE